MNSRINLALSALHKITAFKLISTLVLAITALNPFNACAMENLWTKYEATITLQDGANTIKKDCIVEHNQSGVHQSMIEEHAAQCAGVCNDLMNRSPEFRALVLDNSVCIWQPRLVWITHSLGKRSISLQPEKLFVKKSLCEHGKNCETCKNNYGCTFAKLMRAEEPFPLGGDGIVQCIPIEIECNNEKLNMHTTVALSTLCRTCLNNTSVIDLTDQDIITMAMATHPCNKMVTQIMLLGVHKFRRGTFLNNCTTKDVLLIICGYIKRATPEDIAEQTNCRK